MTTDDMPAVDRERADLLETLAVHRGFLRHTVRDLTDEQAGERTTASELCLGGLIKHVTRMESNWAGFIGRGPDALSSGADGFSAHMASFHMEEGESLAGLLERYAQVAQLTDDLVVSLGSLDASQPLPAAPWFEPGARWSARRTLLHVIAETAQHAGHADIIRESLDGAKTMG
jgi:hypothetical protein